jgi:hypothetical protein
MKKIIIAFTLVALYLCAISGCGGGAGDSSTPKGENPKLASVVQVLPSHYIAQTNTEITIHAKVLDGNGMPVRGERVWFTNLSAVGRLSDTNAKTDNIGIATVILKSTSEGFSTIQAEVDTAMGVERDQRTVFFSRYSDRNLTPSLDLSVSGSGNPYTLLETSDDSTVTLTATVYNAAGYFSGMTVAFGADRPYKVGTDPNATCSDGSETCDIILPSGDTVITNESGQASVPLMIVPATLMPAQTFFNVWAVAENGAYNIVTLTVEPVEISSVSVSANPISVDSGGTSTITASVMTTAGTPAPDGTSVNFTTTNGGIDPFSTTTDGIAETTYSAPTLEPGALNQTAIITASAGGEADSVSVTIIAPEAEPVEPPTPPTDTTSPTVTATDPVDGGTLDISDEGGDPVPVTITFSENIDCSTVTTTTITLTPIGTSPAVPDWTLTSCSGAIVTFRGTFGPAGAPPNNQYTVNVGTGVEDLAGNPCVAEIFTFSVVD